MRKLFLVASLLFVKISTGMEQKHLVDDDMQEIQINVNLSELQNDKLEELNRKARLNNILRTTSIISIAFGLGGLISFAVQQLLNNECQ